MILYEYPFNEGIRTMLRLEHLFDRLGQLIARDAAVDHHYALATLFEIMDVASRADLKSDLLKDLEKHKQQFNAYRGNPSISEAPGIKLWYVGDTVDDARPAQAAGIPFVGIAAPGTPYRGRLLELFEQHGALAVIEDINQLPEVLNNR